MTGLYRPVRFLQDNLFNRNRIHKFLSDVDIYSQIIPSNSLCFDIGANIGDITEVLLRIGAKVIAFEPQVDCLIELKERCKTYSNLETVCTAIGSTSAIATLHVRKFRGQSGLLKYWEVDIIDTFDVPVITLDAAIKKYGLPYYCKIDVEGYELEVINGLSQAIPIMSMEYHLTESDILKTNRCIYRLRELGFNEINFTPHEKIAFKFKDWIPISKFHNWFPNLISENQEYHYGNILIRW